MRTELPVCKRCCFCLPLRYGLIVWGYLKLITSCFVMARACFVINDLRHSSAEDLYKVPTYNVIVLGIAGVVALIDLCLTIAYVVGCHQKNVKLLRIYYLYSTCLVALLIVFSLYTFGTMMYSIYQYNLRRGGSTIEVFMYGIMHVMIHFGNVALQIYILLLVRSEIIILDNGGQVRFMKNITEAGCTLDINTTDGKQQNEKKNKGVDNDDEVRIYV